MNFQHSVHPSFQTLCLRVRHAIRTELEMHAHSQKSYFQWGNTVMSRTKSRAQLSVDLIVSLFPILLMVAVLIQSVPEPVDASIFEKSRLAVSLGDFFLLSCRAGMCDGSVHPNTWNLSAVLDHQTIAEKTGLESFSIGGTETGKPTYFVPRAALIDGEIKIIWFGVD